jgi:hypothetical protein
MEVSNTEKKVTLIYSMFFLFIEEGGFIARPFSGIFMDPIGFSYLLE